MKLFDVYSLYDIEPVRGKGNYVYTADGTPYLDFYGGHAVISIGHSHPRYVDAVSRQVSQLAFYSNSVKNTLQQRLADLLGEISGYDDYQLFLANSGAEANENAIKLASFATGRLRILAFDKAFHGRTSAAVAATDNPRIQAPVNKTDNIVFSPLNDIEAATRLLESQEFAAVIIEGIQGVAGIRMVDDDFLRRLSEVAAATGTLLIADEIQSGYGRTGKFFAHQHAGIRPDIITSAKGIANGFPMSAVLVSPEIRPEKGMLGTTFGGNHLACAAAIAVLEIMRDENLVENAARTGERLIARLRAIPEIKEVRGRGLMIGMEIDGDASELRRKLLFGNHVFTGGAGIHTVRLLPPLTITDGEADIFIERLKKAIKE
ncbi:aspartate aminotransferase family protein [Sangeribacter muris]|jgi:acetylornithine aminotransferase|uniref:aspartate aminotransferase family protein n=1 Tax=Sangeribacter muris TaxID=2880703 RepID=UPI001A3083B9|nr:aminotransferase class III-fold pyridoxal phosphate-dependent enzyme [Sangeribacter muris]MBJ2193530.1 aminotransferase class III-fold pyridoxal phosphate-dependent enzyme [Muribaculaceae bacterium]